MTLVIKNPPANAEDIRDLSLIPGLGRSPGEGNGNSLQYSCLEKSMDRGAWWAIVHGGHKEPDTTEQLTLSLSFMVVKCLDPWSSVTCAQKTLPSLQSMLRKG